MALWSDTLWCGSDDNGDGNPEIGVTAGGGCGSAGILIGLNMSWCIEVAGIVAKDVVAAGYERAGPDIDDIGKREACG